MAERLPGSTQGAPSTVKIGGESTALPSRSHEHRQVWFTGDGTTTQYALDWTPRDVSQIAVYVAGARQRPADRGTAYDFSLTGSTITFSSAPAGSAAICIDEVTS